MEKKDKVAVLIKTCSGRPSLLWVLNSLKFALQEIEYRIYISDEKPLDDWKKNVYDKLTQDDHHIELQKSGIKCGVARNKLVDKLQGEELVLRLDDDFELGGNFNFSSLKNVLQVSKEIGFCSDLERQIGKVRGVSSGAIRPTGGDFKITPPKLVKKFHNPWKKFRKISGFRYSFAEHTRNLLLIKREVLEKVRWNEDLIFQGEHEEFMLSVKEADYRGAYTADSIHYHRDDLAYYRNLDNNDSQKNYRPGEKEKKRVLMKKIGCDEIVSNYPLSWYLIEAGRRILENISLQ